MTDVEEQVRVRALPVKAMPPTAPTDLPAAPAAREAQGAAAPAAAAGDALRVSPTWPPATLPLKAKAGLKGQRSD